MSGAADMLKALSGAQAARLQPGIGRTPANAAGAPDFATLLEQAKSGEIVSGVPIRVPSTLGVELSRDQAERLSQAADRAEASGAGRAMILMDGKGYNVDVATRTLTGVVDMNSPSVLAGIDAVVVAANAGGSGGQAQAGAAGLPGFKSSPGLNQHLARILAREEGPDSSAA